MDEQYICGELEKPASWWLNDLAQAAREGMDEEQTQELLAQHAARLGYYDFFTQSDRLVTLQDWRFRSTIGLPLQSEERAYLSTTLPGEELDELISYYWQYPSHYSPPHPRHLKALTAALERGACETLSATTQLNVAENMKDIVRIAWFNWARRYAQLNDDDYQRLLSQAQAPYFYYLLATREPKRFMEYSSDTTSFPTWVERAQSVLGPVRVECEWVTYDVATGQAALATRRFIKVTSHLKQYQPQISIRNWLDAWQSLGTLNGDYWQKLFTLFFSSPHLHQDTELVDAVVSASLEALDMLSDEEQVVCYRFYKDHLQTHRFQNPSQSVSRDISRLRYLIEIDGLNPQVAIANVTTAIEKLKEQPQIAAMRYLAQKLLRNPQISRQAHYCDFSHDKRLDLIWKNSRLAEIGHQRWQHIKVIH